MMMEAFSDEGQEIVVKRCKFEPVLNTNAIQTGEFSLEDTKTSLRNRMHRFHFGITLSDYNHNVFVGNILGNYYFP